MTLWARHGPRTAALLAALVIGSTAATAFAEAPAAGTAQPEGPLAPAAAGTVTVITAADLPGDVACSAAPGDARRTPVFVEARDRYGDPVPARIFFGSTFVAPTPALVERPACLKTLRVLSDDGFERLVDVADGQPKVEALFGDAGPRWLAGALLEAGAASKVFVPTIVHGAAGLTVERWGKLFQFAGAVKVSTFGTEWLPARPLALGLDAFAGVGQHRVDGPRALHWAVQAGVWNTLVPTVRASAGYLSGALGVTVDCSLHVHPWALRPPSDRPRALFGLPPAQLLFFSVGVAVTRPF